MTAMIDDDGHVDADHGAVNADHEAKGAATEGKTPTAAHSSGFTAVSIAEYGAVVGQA
jgi:hypothetical protein